MSESFAHLTRDTLKKFAPKAKRLTELHSNLHSILPRYQIDSLERVSCFMAQCAHESRGFQYLEENMNYSATRLDQVFYKYFSGAGRDPYEYARQPEKIANVVYANRMGNGDTDSGDGWRYRGRGYIQLTGKNNYQDFAEYIGKSLDDTIEFVSTVSGAIESACWFWDVNHLNFYADERDMRKITRIINGGYHHLESRIMLYEQIKQIILDSESGSKTDLEYVNDELMYGDRGESVRRLQRALGMNEEHVDGVFGRETRKHVKRYQKSVGMISDGIATRLMLTKLYTGL